MSDCEQINQFAHDKWANVSILLRLLRKNERMSESLGFFEPITHFLFCTHKKWAILSKKFKFLFFCLFFTVSKKAKVSLISSEQSEQITQVAQDKLATVSDSLRLLRRNKRSWANLSGRSPKISEWGNYSLFERRTQLLPFFVNKWAICSEIGCANSQPCMY